MYEAGKAAQVSAEMRRYNIALLGLSETRWLQAGQKRLASSELLLYSGHEEVNAAHTEGVEIMLSRTAQKALLGWEAHGSRIITASFTTKKKNIKRRGADAASDHHLLTARLKLRLKRMDRQQAGRSITLTY